MRGHAATIAGSARLQRLLQYLERVESCTTYQICADLMCTNPARDISELNRDLERLGDERRVRCEGPFLQPNGKRVHRFRLQRVEVAA